MHSFNAIYVIASIPFLFDHPISKTYQLYINKQNTLITEQYKIWIYYNTILYSKQCWVTTTAILKGKDWTTVQFNSVSMVLSCGHFQSLPQWHYVHQYIKKLEEPKSSGTKKFRNYRYLETTDVTWVCLFFNYETEFQESTEVIVVFMNYRSQVIVFKGPDSFDLLLSDIINRDINIKFFGPFNIG